MIPPSEWNAHLATALAEDLGTGPESGDHSSLACFGPKATGTAVLRAKAPGIVAGMALAPSIFQTMSADIQWNEKVQDGAKVVAGQTLLTAHGPLTSLLSVERTLLNYLQRLSGIATQTHLWKQLLVGTTATMLDTRKTTPGWRKLEKWAVQVGGGRNHRMGLYDYIMLKDNHIDFCGGITQAVQNTQAYLQEHHLHRRIEVETRNMAEVKEALSLPGVNRIMLDNFSVDACAEAVNKIAGNKETEASGGITHETLRAYALTGVDYISIGALTYSVPSLDLHFKAEIS